MAAGLFGPVLAVTCAKAFAGVVSEEIGRGGKSPRANFRSASRHARPTLIAANPPSLMLRAAGFGGIGVALAGMKYILH
ncbi:hypothetical protein [Rhodosalinus sp. K401]|uniref:hypothetical protein n=1 Tax=Rhodosalinus sp. K401 TaxID=3239195 RepID=UPI003525EAF7